MDFISRHTIHAWHRYFWFLSKLGPVERILFITALSAFGLTTCYAAYLHLNDAPLLLTTLLIVGVPAFISFPLFTLYLTVRPTGSSPPTGYRAGLDAYFWHIIADENLPVPPQHLRELLLNIGEQLAGVNYAPLPVGSTPEIIAQRLKLQAAPQRVGDAIAACLAAYIRKLPRFGEGQFSLPLYEVMDSYLIHDMVQPLRNLADLGLLQDIPWTIHNAAVWVTEKQKSPDFAWPQYFKGTRKELVDTYLTGTPIKPLFEVQVPYQLTDQSRFEHMWLIANSGHGKTQTLQHLISKDLERVAKGECSVVVIDSENKMIPLIAGLKMFAPGEPLHDRLVVLDPSIAAPAINLLRLQDHDLAQLFKLYSFIFGQLLESDMTANQQTLFENCILLLRTVPTSTLRDMYDMLKPGALDSRYKLNKVDPALRQFFEEDFVTKGADGYEATKKQLRRRLNTLFRDSFFREMFSSQQHKFDLFDEMNAGKIILINTAHVDTRMFGRLVLALVANAVRRRSRIDNALPAFIYVDECDQYVKDDPTAIDLLARARKTNIGMIFAHRWLKEIGLPVAAALESVASIIFAGGLRGDDATHMAKVMDGVMKAGGPDLLTRSEKLLYTVYIRGEPIRTIHAPKLTLEKLPQMSDAAFAQQTADMKANYGAVAAPPVMQAAGEDSFD